MLVVIPVVPAALRRVEDRAGLLRMLLEASILQNRSLLRQGLIRPSLYESIESGDVQFRNEPWAPAFDEFATGDLVYKRGWADCDDVAALRIAELREAGEQAAGAKIYWREFCKRCDRKLKNPRDRCCGEGRSRVLHAQVRRADGSVEDPARYLGMGAER